MELKPYVIEMGERFGKFTVLRKRDHRYSVGCECGTRFLVTARKLKRGEAKCRGCAPKVADVPA